MDGIEAAARLVIGTTFPRLFQLGERTEFRIGKLTWTTDASTFIISNDRTSLLCRVSEIIFGKRSKSDIVAAKGAIFPFCAV